MRYTEGLSEKFKANLIVGNGKGRERKDGGIGREEELKNEAVSFFRKIAGEFYSDGFTEEDIRDAFGNLAGGKGHKRKKWLKYLVEEELLDYDAENKTYKINHSSPKVATLMEE